MPRRARHSLQGRLTVGLFAMILLTAALAGALSFLWALHDANEILDGTLEDTVRLVASGQMSLPREPAQLPGSEPDNDVLLVPLPESAVAGDPGVAAVFAPLADGLHTVQWQGRSWRVLVARLPQGPRLAVAQQTEVRDEVAQHSAVRTLIPLLLLIPLLTLLVRVVVRRTLAPVSNLAQHMDTHAMAHAANLPEVDVPLEIQPFVQSIKRLLGELTAALDHQQRFVANAAHELRSPVAALLLQAANLENVVQDAPARDRLAQLRRGIARMQHLLEQLLSMARSEAPATEGRRPVRLADVARQVLADLVPDAQARGIDLGMDRCDAELCVPAAPVDLSTLLQNVVGNAVKYCPAGSVVTLSVLAQGDDAVVVVEDDGPGIPAGELERVFEPFYRAAGGAEPGSGLGLSIVAAIAGRLGATHVLAPGREGRGVRFEYRQRACPCGAT